MCSQSVSGSSLLSGYNEDDVRERSGRSRREFEEIDAVLYDEEKSKRATIKKICEEWSSKPHFRIRGRLFSIERQSAINFPQSFRPLQIAGAESTAPSSTDLLTNTGKISYLNSNELNVSLFSVSTRHRVNRAGATLPPGELCIDYEYLWRSTGS